ncbi:TetR family transcriptional regulator [Asanoa ferruginea]|uniref:TetR family transcriptional regulator n=1 Tax=Asanoa ferruginea TaxID=53367 RepID=A0A3D9ZVT9_9ACTN|nr:TetR/AcrR family transcriptional regulator [Asanoa ferruginea]REG01308.1 TetR family transcriptional regulator [Asanoa ferruginea]GIF53870.1 TetR family transcriptional regulator [Asanoa ferruginea]
MARKAAAGTRDRILDTAARLFYDHGVRAVGMQQIIDAAGCGKNVLYREFPSKNDLVAGYLRRSRETWQQEIAAATRGVTGDAATRLVALVRATADTVGKPNYRGCPFRNYLAEFADHTDPAGKIATAHLRDTRAEIDVLVAELAPARPYVLADRIWLIIEGLHSAAAHPGGTRAAETAVSLVTDLIDVGDRVEPAAERPKV